MAKHIITINTESIQKTAQHAGCSECQTSCQSAWQSDLHKISYVKEKGRRSRGTPFFLYGGNIIHG